MNCSLKAIQQCKPPPLRRDFIFGYIKIALEECKPLPVRIVFDRIVKKIVQECKPPPVIIMFETVNECKPSRFRVVLTSI